MPVLYVRLAVMSVLCAAIVGLAASSDWQTGDRVYAAEPLEWECAACGVSLPTSTELVTIGGERWALCGDACVNEITAQRAE